MTLAVLIMSELELIKLARAAWTPLGIAALVLILLYLVAKLVLNARSQRSDDEAKAVPAGVGAGDEIVDYGSPPSPSLTPPSFRIFKLFWILALVVAVLAFAAFALPSFLSDTNLRGVVVYETTNDTVEGAKVSVDGYPQLNYVTQKDGNFLITIPNRQRQDQYTVRAWLTTPSATLVGNQPVADGDSKKSFTVTLKGGPIVSPPSAAGQGMTPPTASPRHTNNRTKRTASSPALTANDSATKVEPPVVSGKSDRQNSAGSGSSDFEARCREHQGDELQLAQLGEQAFSRLDYRATITCLEQARRVQSSKVWESKYPLLAAAYLLGNHDRNRFQSTLQEMLGEMRLNNSFLHHPQTIGFALQTLTYVRPYLDPEAQDYIDNVVTKQAIQIKDTL